MLVAAVSCGFLLLGACDNGGGDSGGSGEDAGTGARESTGSRPSGTSAPAVTSGTETGVAPVTRVFDPETMRTSVLQVLEDGYRVADIEDVTCPADQPVEVGTTFDCTARIAGQDVPVPIAVNTEEGQYEVGQPAEVSGPTP
ncbi:DUF4333 domain-containing protein [Prauserella marina]|uniref:DUF4333 domain-containing protein n=1 Tax=Prauserella marina TaxID=530584 RepID=UPI00115FE200|nr:DUF4333 domain-containing protein [Prauserella marina]